MVAMEIGGVHLVAVPPAVLMLYKGAQGGHPLSQGAKKRPVLSGMIGLTDLITGWVLNGSSWQESIFNCYLL